MKVIEIPVDLLRPKVRVRRDVGDLLALADSIREYGLLQPLVVSEGDDGKYEIVLGYRRYLAALEAGIWIREHTNISPIFISLIS